MLKKTLKKVLKQEKQQDLKIALRLYKHKTKLLSHKSCYSAFKNLFYDSKIYYIMSFTCLIQVLRVQFGQSGKRPGSKFIRLLA